MSKTTVHVVMRIYQWLVMEYNDCGWAICAVPSMTIAIRYGHKIDNCKWHYVSYETPLSGHCIVLQRSFCCTTYTFAWLFPSRSVTIIIPIDSFYEWKHLWWNLIPVYVTVLKEQNRHLNNSTYGLGPQNGWHKLSVLSSDKVVVTTCMVCMWCCNCSAKLSQLPHRWHTNTKCFGWCFTK